MQTRRVMRSLYLLAVCGACSSAELVVPEPPASVRERLVQGPVVLEVSPVASAGVVTAARRVSGGWMPGTADLVIEQGELVASADAAGTVTLEGFSIDVGPIAIPDSVLGYEVALTDIRLELEEPVISDAAWDGDNDGTGALELPLVLTWSLTNHGETSPLGSPELPRLPAELHLTGTGTSVDAVLRIEAPGDLWSWANLVKFQDLAVTLSAHAD